jgi:hypothetical protein
MSKFLDSAILIPYCNGTRRATLFLVPPRSSGARGTIEGFLPKTENCLICIASVFTAAAARA